MKEISRQEATNLLCRHRAAGFHLDDRVFREVERPGRLFLFSLESADELFRLVWQSTEEVRALAPVGSSRTVGDCAARLAGFRWRFEDLVDAGHQWFRRCLDIDRDFRHASFGYIAVTPVNEHEKRETPAGTHYIFDGVHKTIVLAKKLLRQEVDYVPVGAVLFTPRRD